MLSIHVIFVVVIGLLAIMVDYMNAGACFRAATFGGTCLQLTYRFRTRENCCKRNEGRYYTDADIKDWFMQSLTNPPKCVPSCTANSCDKLSCPPNRKCILNPVTRNATCECNIVCNTPTSTNHSLNRPFCSSNGITYTSECEMHKASCQDQVDHVIAHYGACFESQICTADSCIKDRTCVLSENGNIVCESDLRRIPLNSLVTRAHMKPLCGIDGVTYPSRLPLIVTGQLQYKSIGIAHFGNCTNKTCSTGASVFCKPEETCLSHWQSRIPVCKDCQHFVSKCKQFDIYGAVCGENNKTYDNLCHLRSQECETGQYIGILKAGPCHSR